MPNILLIFPDQWRGDCLGTLDTKGALGNTGALGNPAVETPFLDQLAHEGVTFTSAYSVCPSCIATRACLATGQSPSTCGRIGYLDGVPWRYDTTLMSVLRDGGYQTLCSGKTHFYPQRAHLGFEQLRLYDPQNHEGDFRSDYHVWLERETNGLVRDTAIEVSTNSWIAHPWVHPEYLHPNCWTVDAAIELLERRDPQRPFFLQVGFHRPHPPYDPPIDTFRTYLEARLPPVPVGNWALENDREAGTVDARSGRLPDHILDRTRRAYYAQLTHLDYQIGRLFRWLTVRKWLDNTYVIFLSDHGELLGDHYLFSKFTPHEGSAKVPLIIRPPKHSDHERGIACRTPVTHMDIMPTLLEEAGLPIPGTVEGMSLAPLIRGRNLEGRDFIHGEHAPGEGKSESWQFLTDGKRKFLWDAVTGRSWYFDLEKDPQEVFDLSEDPRYRSEVDLWRGRLIELLADRPQDELSDGKRLLSGHGLPPVRPELMEERNDPDGRARPTFRLTP